MKKRIYKALSLVFLMSCLQIDATTRFEKHGEMRYVDGKMKTVITYKPVSIKIPDKKITPPEKNLTPIEKVAALIKEEESKLATIQKQIANNNATIMAINKNLENYKKKPTATGFKEKQLRTDLSKAKTKTIADETALKKSTADLAAYKTEYEKLKTTLVAEPKPMLQHKD